MYTFSELISNIRKVGKIDSRKMQGQSVFTCKQICKIRDLNYFDAHLFFHEVTTFMLCYLSPLNISISARAIKI